MKETLTAIFEKSPHGYIGYVEELPGANTPEATLEEVKKNLIEATWFLKPIVNLPKSVFLLYHK
jgi:predicted RNase H-like HicB family nuclease